MSFDILSARMYGTGALGDVTNPAGQINSYAKVTATANKTITLDLANASLGAYEQFKAGSEILLHISGVRNASASKANLGKYMFVKIMSVDDNKLTLNSKPLDISPTNYFYQAITVAQFKNLTLSDTISPLAFNETNGYGGILAFKCSATFTLNGNINLVDKGLQTAEYRPLLNQEQTGTLDTDQLSGYENYETANHFVLNKGDGACLIIAKKITCKSTTARIGNPTLNGVQRCRGAQDSYNLPSGATNIGGSSILIVGETIASFNAAIISKYRATSLTAGKGLARCYIATESQLPCDEGLYAYDIINSPTRLRDSTFIKDFGSGIHGVARTTSIVQNSYAKVQSISGGGKTFELTNVTTDGVAKFERNALVMIQAQSNNPNQFAQVGRFFLSKCLSVTTTSGKITAITLENSIDELNVSGFNTTNYSFQAIAIPQYTSFSANNSRTPAFENKRGGIFAIAVNGTCDLCDKKINVEGKGGSSYSLAYTSNARMKDRLPIGHGHGSVFILAKNLKMNTSTRIGATYSGNAYGGASETHKGGGYRGEGFDSISGGSGLRGGVNVGGHNGGFCSNAVDWGHYQGGRQGASLFIVADTIDGLCLDALSTGGEGGNAAKKNGYLETTIRVAGSSGGCGYGGGGATFKDVSGTPAVINNEAGAGGVHGGGAGDGGDNLYSYGGGASGFCTVYANNVTNQDTTNITVD